MATIMRACALAAVSLLLAGCATVSESPTQAVTVRTILDHREVGGVGCVLTNSAGRWFVTSPGRVTVRRSTGNLFVDCKRTSERGQIAGQDRFASRANNTATIGNAVATAGLGYLLDKQTGAGWDYPDTLTVIMKPTAPALAPEQPQGAAGTVVY
ncbi:hypothetical protein KY495_01650 [Massilia sp. PAMC28688]|uniref:hypothetical protein n=1 Tax=Massilia sp. PAMC28688 TaxID=2861283 RepID=UPI001C630FDE|nr:hypothetical protein [Massilia sp. PAMC28688]QYF93971.1 hypothetical protein KY495_01650 [Massilia sp. PAMC28688]